MLALVNDDAELARMRNIGIRRSTRSHFGKPRNVGFIRSSRSLRDIRYGIMRSYLLDFGILRAKNIGLMWPNQENILTSIKDKPIPSSLSPVPYSLRNAGIIKPIMTEIRSLSKRSPLNLPKPETRSDLSDYLRSGSIMRSTRSPKHQNMQTLGVMRSVRSDFNHQPLYDDLNLRYL